MLRRLLVPVALLLMAQSNPLIVPEGTHSLADGPETICGITAASAEDFERQVRASPSAQLYMETEEFVVFEGPQEMSQWVFAKPTYFAFPLATCRRIDVENGSTYMHRAMRCDDTRDDCDRAFLQFQDMDAKARQSVQSKVGS
jgi:hypothetical protein